MNKLLQLLSLSSIAVAMFWNVASASEARCTFRVPDPEAILADAHALEGYNQTYAVNVTCDVSITHKDGTQETKTFTKEYKITAFGHEEAKEKAKQNAPIDAVTVLDAACKTHGCNSQK